MSRTRYTLIQTMGALSLSTLQIRQAARSGADGSAEQPSAGIYTLVSSRSERPYPVQVAGLPSLVEVMSMVGGQVRGADSAVATELTGPSDPLRITASHMLSLQQRLLTVTVEVYNRLLRDVTGASIR